MDFCRLSRLFPVVFPGEFPLCSKTPDSGPFHRLRKVARCSVREDDEFRDAGLPSDRRECPDIRFGLFPLRLRKTDPRAAQRGKGRRLLFEPFVAREPRPPFSVSGTRRPLATTAQVERAGHLDPEIAGDFTGLDARLSVRGKGRILPPGLQVLQAGIRPSCDLPFSRQRCPEHFRLECPAEFGERICSPRRNFLRTIFISDYVFKLKIIISDHINHNVTDTTRNIYRSVNEK